MMQKVFPLLYLIGSLPLILSAPRPIAHVYHLIQTPKTWLDSQTYCRGKYTDLATVISTDDWTKLEEEEKSNSFDSPAWVGVYNDINSWRWSYKNAPLNTNLKWYTGEPSKLIASYSCGALDIGGYWWNLDCLMQKPFLCYNASYSGRFIIISDNPMTWPDAQTYCRQFHTDLATSDNNTDNSLLQAMVIGQTWFGLFRDTWKWSDQSNASSINWMLGSPQNAIASDNCGSVLINQIGVNPCTDLLPFICHTLPPMREIQMVKVGVTTDQNMNDAAVAFSILQIIQQKLKDDGMWGNTTLTWRLQPDGNIFYKMKEKILGNLDSTNLQCVKSK